MRAKRSLRGGREGKEEEGAAPVFHVKTHGLNAICWTRRVNHFLKGKKKGRDFVRGKKNGIIDLAGFTRADLSLRGKGGKGKTTLRLGTFMKSRSLTSFLRKPQRRVGQVFGTGKEGGCDRNSLVAGWIRREGKKRRPLYHKLSGVDHGLAPKSALEREGIPRRELAPQKAHRKRKNKREGRLTKRVGMFKRKRHVFLFR